MKKFTQPLTSNITIGKLSLSKEAIRNLTGNDLRAAVGGRTAILTQSCISCPAS